MLRRDCRPSATPQEALTPQRRVLQAEVIEDEESGSLATRYRGECVNPGGNDEVFECLLPRKEVKKELLQSFEAGTLPLRSDPKTKLQRPPSFKRAKQQLRWYKRARGRCSPTRGAKKAGRGQAREGAQRDVGA